MNDEVLLVVNSEMGKFIFLKDIWDLSFMMAAYNQECLYKINSLLENSKNLKNKNLILRIINKNRIKR